MATTELRFKVFLIKKLTNDRNKEPDVEEVRRFSAPVIFGPGVLGALCAQLENYLPALQGKTYSIFWKDEEGDFVSVSSDQEISHAMQIMWGTNRIVKLFTLAVPEQQPQTPHPQGAVHVGVTCDGCNQSPIQGFRYKCVQCPDYDLCATCEARGVHPDHSMIRFPTSVFPHSDIYRLLRKRFRRVMKESYEKAGKCNAEPAEPQGFSSGDEDGMPGMEGPTVEIPVLQEFWVPSCQFEPKRRRHHKDKADHQRGHGHGHGHGHWRGYDHDQERRKRCADMVSSALGFAKAAASAATGVAVNAAGAAASAANAAGAAATEPANVQYLRSVGQNIAKMLDPLGIDVDIEIRGRPGEQTVGPTPAAPTTTPTTPAAPVPPSATPAAATTGTAQPDTEMPAAATVGFGPEAQMPPQVNLASVIQSAMQNVPNLAAAVQQITDTLAQQHVDSGDSGWTVLNAEEKEGSPKPTTSYTAASAGAAAAAAVTPELSSAAAAVTPQPSAPTANGLYPDLTPPPAPRHPNVMVQQGVDTLLSMGFSNEGGLLTQLLEIHNGDIYKALDVLQVIRK